MKLEYIKGNLYRALDGSLHEKRDECILRNKSYVIRGWLYKYIAYNYEISSSALRGIETYLGLHGHELCEVLKYETK